MLAYFRDAVWSFGNGILSAEVAKLMIKSMENTQKPYTRREIKIDVFVTAGARATGISRLGLRYHREEVLPI
jgi:hypothetical protein